MRQWRNALVAPEDTIRTIIEIIDRSALQIALVADADQILVGTVTDGDIRRAILKGHHLDMPVAGIMNRSPITIGQDVPKRKILEIMRERKLHHLPIVDAQGRIQQLIILDDLVEKQFRNNTVVLMAGGLGTRLRPLTEDCPKPLLKVGSKPILETIIESFVEQGFSNFHLSVNYKADMIREYFGNGSRWGIDIHYLQEDKRLGTAGSLSLLPFRSQEPVIVMNGDLLTKVNYQQLLDFHLQQQAAATMCVREYTVQIPYGVVRLQDQMLTGIEEKPVQKFFVSAGIYVLSPSTLDMIPRDAFYDMPTLFDELVKKKERTAAFPIREYWLDIGRFEEFERANGEYGEVFGS